MKKILTHQYIIERNIIFLKKIKQYIPLNILIQYQASKCPILFFFQSLPAAVKIGNLGLAMGKSVVFGVLIVVGYFTRPLALFLAIYTVITAFIGHPYWGMSGMDQYMAMINFYKNISISGGFMLLAFTGPGSISFDGK